MANKVAGAGVALATPFSADGSIDYAALAKLVGFVADNGVDFLVALGTTAETPTLAEEEKAQVLACIKAGNTRRLPLVVGLGGNSTAELVKKIAHFDFEGVDMLLSVTPYYNKPSQSGLFEHYKAVAEASPVPVMLYNVPGRTGVNLTAETTLRLAHEVKNVAGTKEASGSLPQIGCILRDMPEGFTVMAGDDGLALPLMAIGAQGVISVAANAFPRQISDMVRLATEQRYAEAAKIHRDMIAPIEALFAEGNPVGVKAALALRGIAANVLRLPLVPASDKLMEKMRAFAI
ncbi:MAG: 4-hydroxy-tetrahydrodipicolinate synthase [Prevotellaceae bacterium]|jgi:4-hydroxy-tetrahydrodipicolinate synthase|nr:4-hydroxy-tetrahydrodipicolinate synthase [Prevotellaceae bacterium]